MSIGDLVPDGTFVTPVKGAGYSVSVDHHQRRVRADIWSGAIHRAVPLTDCAWPVSDGHRELILKRLDTDARDYPELRQPFHALKGAWL